MTHQRFLTMQEQEDRVSRKLATKKINTDLGLVTYKYSRKVMFDNLWESEQMYESRGHTYDIQTGELVLAAPRKTFNYLENGTWSDVSLDAQVITYKKYNGFMAAMTPYKNDILVGTTGTTTSDYAVLAKVKLLEQYGPALFHWFTDITYLFEIVDKSDPHIVDEKSGCYYLGYRLNSDTHFNPHGDPFYCTLRDILELSKTDKSEGWMVYLNDDGDVSAKCCKIKTDYYVSKKKLMRMSASNVEKMYTGHYPMNNLSDDFRIVVKEIIKNFNQSDWSNLTDQERRKIIERIYG